MTDTFTQVASQADVARDEALAQLRAAGRKVTSLEEALADARHARLELMVRVAQSGLMPKEHVWIAAGAARTTLFNELQAIKEGRPTT